MVFLKTILCFIEKFRNYDSFKFLLIFLEFFKNTPILKILNISEKFEMRIKLNDFSFLEAIQFKEIGYKDLHQPFDID